MMACFVDKMVYKWRVYYAKLVLTHSLGLDTSVRQDQKQELAGP